MTPFLDDTMMRKCKVELSSVLTVNKEDFGFVFNVNGRSVVLNNEEARRLADCLKHGKDCYMPLGWSVVDLTEKGLGLGSMTVVKDTVTYAYIIDELEKGLKDV